MKEKVLRIFREHGGSFVSGQEICDALNVSRTAVWKVINALKEEGYEFDAVKNRGYRLVSCPDTLTQWEIASRLDTVIMGCRLEAYFRSHTSTNNVLKKLADEGAPEGTVVVADIQEGGKGRRGREWATPPPGTNIAMSILVRPRTEPSRLSPITLVAAMAVRQAVAGMMDDAAYQKDIMIKWPNDIVFNGGKLTGILTELSLEEDRVSYAVIGIGINVNNESFPEELRGKATSMYLETGHRWQRAEIAANILKCFEALYRRFESDGFAGLSREYEKNLAGRGKKAMIMDREPWEGTVMGVNEDGAVLVEDHKGGVHEISSGEISIRGINGYSPC